MWKTISEFPEYEISEDGDVRSYRTPIDGRKSHRPAPYVMIGFVDSLGYKSYVLKKPGDKRPYRRTAHRLVALAFIPNPLGLSDVAHQDGNPRINSVWNLRWSTHFDNQMDMRRHGTMQDGEKSITCKVTRDQVRQIREEHAAVGRGAGRMLSRKYNLSPAQISRIVNGTRWRHLD